MKRVLYLYGGWPGHNPYGVSRWAKKVMHDLDFDVEEINDPFRLDRDLTGYDLIVMGWTQAQTTENMSPSQEQHLREAIEGGTGLAGWHGMCASFRASLTYALLVGGSFLAHPGGEANEVTFPVNIIDRDHPVTRGVKDFHAATEQYYMHIDPRNHVIAETVFTGEHTPWFKDQRMPVAWTTNWGEGRVFYCTLGHFLKDLEDADATRLISQGLAWAARP